MITLDIQTEHTRLLYRVITLDIRTEHVRVYGQLLTFVASCDYTGHKNGERRCIRSIGDEPICVVVRFSIRTAMYFGLVQMGL